MPRPVTKRAVSPRQIGPDEKYFSKLIGKALNLLAILRVAPQPLSLNEVTLRIGVAKSSVFRILYTLEVSGYVERDAAGRYALAHDLQTWGRGQWLSTLLKTADPLLRELNREFRETVSLAARFQNRIEVIALIESPQLIRMGNTVGRILPPHASSLGKAITAWQSEEVRERLLRSYGVHRFTSHTITDEVELKKEYERTRERGYSTDQEESVLEGCCFGAPVIGPDEAVWAAISMSLPKMRLPDRKAQNRMIATVRRAASRTGEVLRTLARGGP